MTQAYRDDAPKIEWEESNSPLYFITTIIRGTHLSIARIPDVAYKAGEYIATLHSCGFDKHGQKVYIWGQNSWPRYYFDLEVAKDQVERWCVANDVI